MDKPVESNKINCVEEDQEDVFEDALEESTEDNKESLNENSISTTKILSKTIDSSDKTTNITKQVLTENNYNRNLNKEIDKKPKNKESKLDNEINNKLRIDAIKEKISKFPVYTLEDGVKRCIESAFNLNFEFFNNEFEFVITFCEQNYNKNIFYSLIYGAMYFIKTWMSFEQPEIQKCLEILNKCVEYVNSRRRVYSWSEMIKKVNFNESFTDEEAHAEIIYGELQILIGSTTFIKDQNFSSLFKAVFRFKQGYQSFKYCKEIYQNRTKWESDVAKDDFYSNLLAASGVFHLSMSLAPPRVLSILEFMGFSCEQNFALQQLRKSINFENTIRSNYSLIVMLIYYSYTKVTIGFGNHELDEFEELVQLMEKRNPNSIFTNYFLAKKFQLEGELDKSILTFKEIVETSKDLKQLNNACNWELLFLYAVKKQYHECAKTSDILRKTSLWSPCVFNFIYGISLYMIKEQTGNSKLQDEIDECLREVPALRRRLAGKSTPIEKLAMSKSSYYFTHDRKLALPLHELMFYYNIISVFIKNKAVMNDNLKMIEDEIKKCDLDKLSKSGQKNDYCLLLTLKASYLRHLNYPSLAIETLEQMFIHSKEIEENHLLPFAKQELAFCYLQLEQYEIAKKIFKSCINHTKYTAELILHFRAYNGLRYLKTKMKELEENDAKMKVQKSNSSNGKNQNSKIEVDAAK